MTRRAAGTTLAGALLALLAPHGAAITAEPDVSEAARLAECRPSGNLKPYCGVPFPEDLEPVPGTLSVIASDMHLKVGTHGLEPEPGVLKRLDLRSGAVTPLYPAATGNLVGSTGWGDPACPGEIGAKLLPHGIHLSRRKDGAWQLLAVNHGGRESVEFFELMRRGERWSLAWRGCVVAPASSHLNDVAALPSGGFLVSTMHLGNNAETQQAAIKAAKGENTGFLWRWSPHAPIRRQEGSNIPMPNGVQVDASGRYAYINSASKGGEVRKLDLASGQVVGSVAIPNPDNASWATDGRLVVAGVAAGTEAHGLLQEPWSALPRRIRGPRA